MRHFKKLAFILCLLPLVSCTVEPSQTTPKYDYEDVKELHINYEELFAQNDPLYFVYFYTKKCLHCELIKNDVIHYAKSQLIKTYFIECNSDIPILEETGQTIGLTSIKGCGILGTPALIVIDFKTLIINVSGMDIILNILKKYN